MIETPQVNHAAFKYYSRLKRVKEHVDQYYCEEVSLDKAAQIAATEKTYFSTFFRKKVGITFTEWLRRFRVAKAVELMQANNHPLRHIAFEVGFQDYRAFQRTFKKCMKMTPREFKRSIVP